MNVKKLRCELIRALRGDRSQGQLSQRLKIGFNKVYKWEKGTASISWSEFLVLAKLCKCDVSQAIQGSYLYRGKIDNAANLVIGLLGTDQVNTISKRTGFGTGMVRRWLKGTSEPSLDVILSIMHRTQVTLVEFLTQLVDIESLPSLRKEYDLIMQTKQIFRSNLFLEAVACALNLQEYADAPKHPTGLIAKKLGISVSEEEAYLKLLLQCEVIEFDGKKYHHRPGLLDLTSQDTKIRIEMRKFWLKKSLDLVTPLKAPPKEGMMHWAVAAVSEETGKLMTEAQKRFHHEIQLLMRTDPRPKNTIRLLCVQLLDIPELADLGGSINPTESKA